MEFALFGLWLVYLVPFMLAAARDHDQVVGVLLLNVLLGWTGIGWLAALVWALQRPEPLPTGRRRPAVHLVPDFQRGE